jgi:hypothetical protein
MRITYQETKEVHLSQQHIADITREGLDRYFGLPKYADIDKEGYLTEWFDTHGSGHTERVRVATEIDKAALLLIRYTNSTEFKKKWGVY